MYFLQVHYQRSVKRVCDKVNKSSSPLAHKAFIAIAYAIPTAKNKDHVETLFKVLCGAKPLMSAIEILPKPSPVKEYLPDHRNNKWKACQHWCNWWMRPNHLST